MKKLLLMLGIMTLVPVFESQAGLLDFAADVTDATVGTAADVVDATVDPYDYDGYYGRPRYRRYRDDSYYRPYYDRSYRSRGW